jgi:hypothetical protein
MIQICSATTTSWWLVNPLTAVQRGNDVSICGCRHRGKSLPIPRPGYHRNVLRSCYDTLAHGPRVVWDAYQRGIYPDVSLAKARKLLAHRKVRLGAYGNPGAVPLKVWETALDRVAELNGYTHVA